MTEKSDLTLNVDDYKLNVRATAAIIHNGKILLHHNVNEKHYVLIGGRVKIGEDSATTVKREVKEEIGKEIEVTECVGTIENFFTMDGKKFHEYMFIQKAEFKNDDDKKIDYTLKNVEGEDWLEYVWIDIQDLDKYEILPGVMKDIFKKGKYPVHIINKE